MKHLTTLLTMAITFTGLGQQMPYNPDANGDDFVGVDDVLGVLGVYDTALMQPDLTCDYEGTELEQLVGGLFEQSLVLDSVYIEYLLVDSVVTFLPGCPAPVTIETVLDRSYTITSITFQTGQYSNAVTGSIMYLGYLRRFTFEFLHAIGQYQLYVDDFEVGQLTNNSNTAYLFGQSLPFSDDIGLDENGVNVGSGATNFLFYSESFRFIPFWHEAE